MLVLLIILVIVIGGALGLFIAPYNSLVRLRNVIQESWRQVDVELNRRYELIPNLVETVRAGAAHERNTLEEVTRLRNQAVQMASGSHSDGPDPQRDQIESQLTGAVRNLMVQVEAYPQLRSNENFLELQRELAATEDRIANGRRYYNANVRAYNTKIESFPSNLAANMFHFEKAGYFQVDDAAVRSAPTVNFGEISQRPPQSEPGAPGQLEQGGQTPAPGYQIQQPGGSQQPQYHQPGTAPDDPQEPFRPQQ